MDIQPENINPRIVDLGRVNPVIRQYFALYLSGMPAGDTEEPMTWQQCLELMVVKLGEQYAGALEGWENSLAKMPDGPLTLVDEKPIVQSKVEHQLEIAKGMLGKLISPARMMWKEKGGRDEDFPPIQLGKSFVEQVEALMGGDIEKYIQPDNCPRCFGRDFLIEDGVRKCVVCDAKSGKLNLIVKLQQVEIALRELISLNKIEYIPERLTRIFPNLP